MYVHREKERNADARTGGTGNSGLQALADASAHVSQLRAMQAMADAAPRVNQTGLPDQLKDGIETMSGLSLDGVKVHYNSSRPAQLNALAYAQGTDIHVAPGQEHHLPHEAWHLVQQAQGRVKPTMRTNDGTPVNDDQSLEREADVMGSRAVQMKAAPGLPVGALTAGAAGGVAQRVKTKVVAGVTVTTDDKGGYPQWDMAGFTWHLNLSTDPEHVTKETSPKEHFYYKRQDDGTIKNAVSGQKGKKKFSQLPETVQTFIINNYDSL